MRAELRAELSPDDARDRQALCDGCASSIMWQRRCSARLLGCSAARLLGGCSAAAVTYGPFGPCRSWCTLAGLCHRSSRGGHFDSPLLVVACTVGLDHTLTVGVVSGLGREVTSPTGRPITNVIQVRPSVRQSVALPCLFHVPDQSVVLRY